MFSQLSLLFIIHQKSLKQALKVGLNESYKASELQDSVLLAID
jgi:hypothetical protein